MHNKDVKRDDVLMCNFACVIRGSNDFPCMQQARQDRTV